MFVEKENNLNHTDSQAEVACRQAMSDAGFAFGSPPAAFHWSQLIKPTGDKKAAKAAYEVLLNSEPYNKSALEGLAYLYQTLGMSAQAQQYRKKLRYAEVKALGLKEEYQNEAVEFLLAKTGEALQPDNMPTALITAYFDKYAHQYDSLLQGSLKYQGHELIREQVIDVYKATDRHLNVLDIGCGTGLVGEAIFEFSKVIHGMDLSERMLDFARERNVYDQLYAEDYLIAIKPMKEAYDLVTASDVLNYRGDLGETFYRVNDALEDGGEFIFTIELGNKAKDFVLRNTGRYQHSNEYIQKLAHQHNYTIIHDEDVELRKEKGNFIDAKLYRLKKS